MKRRLFLLFAAFFVLSADAQTDARSKKLDEYFAALTRLKKFNGNVLVASGDRVLLRKSYNMEPARESLGMRLNSKLIIASVSKVFIKYAILLLEEQGRLNRSDKLEKFIPGFPSGNRITVRHLMEHKSGLPRELTDYERYDSIPMAQVAILAQKEKLLFEPGTQTLYSNIGFSLLHYIIDKAAPAGYENYIRTMLRRLGIRNTGEFNEPTGIKNFAWGFDNENGLVKAASIHSINRFEAGNFYASIDDLYAFSKQLTAGKLVSKSRALSLFAGDSLLAQAGGRSGYRSYFYKNLNTGITFLFTCNYTDIPIQEITADIVELLAGRPYSLPAYIDRKEIALPDSVLARYGGSYVLEADEKQVFTVSAENGRLVATDAGGEKSVLSPDSPTSFFEDPHSKDGYEFSPDPKAGGWQLTIISTGIRLKTRKLR